MIRSVTVSPSKSSKSRRNSDPRQGCSTHGRRLQPCSTMLAHCPQLLQPVAPQPPPTAHRASTSTSAPSDASIVSSNDQKSSKSPRFARDLASAGARANRNQSAPRQLQHGGQHGRAGQRRAPRVTQIAAQRPQHRRFPPAQHEIGPRPCAMCTMCQTTARSRLTTRLGGCVCVDERWRVAMLGLGSPFELRGSRFAHSR